MKKDNKKQLIVPESISGHIEEEYKKDKDFRKAYDEEVLKLRLSYKMAQLRKARRLTQKALAKKVGTTQQTISRLEDPNNSQISLKTLSRIAVVLKARLAIDFVPQD